MTSFPILNVLREKRSLAIAAAVAGVLFLFDERLMATLPMERNLSCVIGGALTPFNIGFSAIFSLLSGLMAAGVVELLRQKRKTTTFATTSLMGIGASVGILTTFCTACTLPALSLLGLSVGFGLFNTYNLIFKIASLVLLFAGLYQFNKQLGGHCERCAA